MTWFKVDDGFHCHPKVLEAGNECVGLYVRCGSYCAQHLTDGFVPAGVAALYGSAKLAAALVRARLWVPVDGGWQMHDYLNYNPSRDQVEADREAAAERQRKAREKRAAERAHNNGHAVSHVSSHAVTHAEVTQVVTDSSRCESHDPDPTRPDPTRSTSSAYVESQGDTWVAGATPPGGARRRATRIPDDFAVTDSMVVWARKHAPNVDGRVETEQFRDYWHAKSGKDATKLDWPATWRTWMRKAEQDSGRSRRNSARPTRTATALASVESAFAEWDARQARGETNLFALPPAHRSRGA
jgi:hypothetical protein